MRFNQFACYQFTMEQEGGFSTDPNDPGNWTGCEVGTGELKGTNKGISACAYPDLDLASLTDYEIFKIYDRDYWDVVAGDQLPRGIDLCTWDSGVNCGPGKGVEWLQRATGNPNADGAMGPETLSYVDKIEDPDAVIDSICDQRMVYYRSLSTWDRYGEGWSRRVGEMRELAHDMSAEVLTSQVVVTIAAPPTVKVTVRQVNP